MAKWGEIPPLAARQPAADPVNQPPHYNNSSIECIDAMAAMSEGTNMPSHAAYCWQNAFKYLWRFPYKHKSIEGSLTDLRKCQYYLDRLITQLEGSDT